MPKQSPIPEDYDRPFWEACNEERLVLQYCTKCDRFQHPPKIRCDKCRRADTIEWRQVDGSGTIYSYAVIHDTPIAALQPDQPYNAALIAITAAPGVNMISHLPGTPVDKVPLDAPVELIFETTLATGQKVPEWRVIK
ncbi:hypothetical protein AU467_31200 [Mesorhizobium loti]|uniref:Zn-ribbon domain-containing OB-fold protein n=1 Tax=Rhizobium loti TaxID=381 RepID=A0A101KNW4_RHILI|nr:hypothetical protein AU467_31200 [Mesorhizobium loti]